MEVKEPCSKYLTGAPLQETEVGPLPQDWQVIRLSSRAEIQSGIAKNANATLREPITVPYLRVANVQDGFLDLAEVSTIAIERSDLSRYAVLPGDVLMNEGGDLDKLGRGAIWNGQIDPCVHQNHVFVVRCKAGFVPEYLNAWTSSAQARRYFMLAGRQTTNLASINKTSLGDLTIAVPPTEDEQKEIAEALTDADAMSDSLEQLLTKKRQIKQGTMQSLLTGKRRLPGFQGEWRQSPFGALLSIKHGRSQKQVECDNGEFPILATGGQIGWANRFLYDKPSVLIGRKGTIDQPRYMEMPFWSIDTLFYSEVKEPNVAKFLYYRFCLIEWMRHNEASGVPSLGAKIIESIEIAHPEHEEQLAIANVLSDMDADIAAVESRLAKARNLKQAMAQALLTGRIRLVEPENA